MINRITYDNAGNILSKAEYALTAARVCCDKLTNDGNNENTKGTEFALSLLYLKYFKYIVKLV